MQATLLQTTFSTRTLGSEEAAGSKKRLLTREAYAEKWTACGKVPSTASERQNSLRAGRDSLSLEKEMSRGARDRGAKGCHLRHACSEVVHASYSVHSVLTSASPSPVAVSAVEESRGWTFDELGTGCQAGV